MPTDQLVTADHILKAVMEYERRTSRRVLAELEKLEPDLIEYLLEGLTRLYHDLTDLGLSGREARKAHRQAEKTAVVCIIALRNAHRELWDEDPGEPPSSEASPPPTP